MMDRLANDPWIQAIGITMLIASVAPWFYLIARWRRYGYLLPYEPRRPVPWGFAGAMLAVAFTGLTILAAVAADGSVDHRTPSAREAAFSLVASIIMQMFGPGLLLFIALISRASRHDIGLPPLRLSAIARDVLIGVVACLAALMPVRLVQLGLMYALDLPNELTKHPLVEMLIGGEPNMVVLALATVVAVVVAPVGEEITFRLLLQGWLEKWEDRRLGWRDINVVEATSERLDEAPSNARASADVSETETIVLTPVPTEPPRRGVTGLPYGWVPIIISSLLFAAAHFGYGPEPVPLFVLALILGYIYQRTHRIIPCIVAHAMFNLLSMIFLWRIVFLGPLD
jgi:membrane protease YdiL (CAAX protease family)